ncbi:hypothetical protein UT300012_24400 [Paraclostridium bifermentans]
MAFNKLTGKCTGCKHKGMHMCLTTTKCVDNEKYEAGKPGSGNKKA